ncbi:MAG: hypothetical protein PVI43_03005 [Candidatus Bathyarchaeota archaeon]
MFEKLKKAISSLWAESKIFKSIIIATSFFLMTVAASLLVMYGRVLLGISFSIILIIGKVVTGIILHKRGYVNGAKELAPKHYSIVRRVQIIVGGGLLTSLGIPFIFQVVYGPIQYSDPLILFLILFTVGAITGDSLGRTFKAY